jgi:Flp pilus assembly protein TadG
MFKTSRYKEAFFAVCRPHRRATCRGMRHDESGVIAILTALGLTSLVGMVGLAIDIGVWYRIDRAMQNAADASVIAAARNGSASFDSEAKAVAAQYGFVDGANGITVTALNNQTCPNGTPGCYQVTVAQASAPKFFSQVLGNFSPALSGAAMASAAQTHSYCLLAIGTTTDPGITTNGAPKADLTGCSMMSNTGSTCNGHNLNATYGDAHKTNNGCGITQTSNVPAVADPYASMRSNIPSDPCGGTYYQEPIKKGTPLPASNQWSGSITLPATKTICGDLQLTGTTTLTTASPGSVLVIYNGQLDTGSGNTLQTAAGSALTIVFTGPDASGTYTHSPTGSGTLDFPAPATGTWKGIAIYQDPSLPAGADVDVSAAGNSPTWNITGIVYLPKSSVTFSGAVNKSSNGASCFALIVDNITINGTGSILANGGCAAAGVTLPTDNVGAIALVK